MFFKTGLRSNLKCNNMEKRSVAWVKNTTISVLKKERSFRPSSNARCSVRAITRSLHRSPSTISRELKRCGWQGHGSSPSLLRTRGIDGYWCQAAHRLAMRLAIKPRTQPKLVVGPTGNALWQLVCTGLASGLSPEQVSGTLARMQSAQRISHESIYTAIHAMPKGGGAWFGGHDGVLASFQSTHSNPS